MLNQFYNYIANELINYWSQEKNIKKGDRFFLRLDDKEEVLQLAEALKQSELTKTFSYEHHLGEKYETFALDINGITLVVAFTSDKVKTDYLALIRNEVSEQAKGWENTALISIVSEQLDTIPGGSLDLQAEGMPLHVISFFNKLKNTISLSNLLKSEKKVLEDQLERLLEEHKLIKLSFFEFEEILATLMKGKIEENDYRNLGMFQDSELDSFSGKSLKNRIHQNRELYEIVKQANEYNDKETQLQKYFKAEDAKQLMEEDWESISFSRVFKAHEEYNKSVKTKKVTIETITGLEETIIWDRALSESASGKRKRNIIIFNSEQKDVVSINIKFAFQGAVKTLNKQFIVMQKKFEGYTEAIVKNTNLQINIQKTTNNEATYTKVTYKHEGMVALGGDFNIVVVPISEYLFDSNRTNFTIDAVKRRLTFKARNGLIVLGQDFPESKLDFKEQNQNFTLQEIGRYEIQIDPQVYNEEEEISFNIVVNDKIIPIYIDNESVDFIPISGDRIWRMVRESSNDMVWIKELNHLTYYTQGFYLESGYVKFFEWEYEWLEQSMRAAKIEAGIIEPLTIELGEDLREAYSRYISYFKSSTMIPSITTVTEDYHERALMYVKAFNNEIQKFKNGVPAGKVGVDLFSLGTITANETVYFTPFHPLMVSYKLKIYELLQNEEIEPVILNRLSPEALIPFIYRNQTELYRPQQQGDAPLWLVFKPVNQVTVTDSSHYLSKVITDKMKQFIQHFKYLFTESSKAPIQINVMNLPDDRQVLKGIIEFMIKEMIAKGPQHIKPIEVTLYTEEATHSSFEKFSHLKTVEQVEMFTKTKLKTKQFDEETVLRYIRENLFFYRRPCISKSLDIRYAHITFYKMHAQEKFAVQSMDEMKSDIALNGLYASVPSMRDQEIYKSGFGIHGYSIDDKDYLVETAYFSNELAANTRNDGSDSYVKSNTILSRITTTDKETLMQIFENSHWVTFVEPSVDLEFFNDFSSNNLVIIHYSDQYTSSNKFDAITVTNKSDQYYNVIKEFLQNREIEGTVENVRNTVQAFNTFNGEWLLRIIGSKGYSDREKLTVISAIKYTLAYLDHPSIKWVPISLEEILRVAGVFNLSKQDGIFSAKNLGVSGAHSDDLLMIGLEVKDGELYIHFYPIEVKFGEIGSEVLSKAKHQVQKTKDLIMNTLVHGEIGEFSRKFYKNFFAQLLISNANKMLQGNIWAEKDYGLQDEIIKRLVKLDFHITDHLAPFIGKGAIVSFKNGIVARSSYLEDDVLTINFSMEDGFIGIVKYMSDLHHWLHNEETDFKKERLLKNQYKGNFELEIGDETVVLSQEHAGKELYMLSQVAVHETYTKPVIDKEIEETIANDEVAATTIELEEMRKEESLSTIENVRIKIGQVENSNKEIYWEYGHKQLANRHLLISGKSGQGKTYFMQCLLLEKAKQGISSIVIDYTEGFLPNQLESEFLDFLGDRLKQQIVYLNKLPINPFTRNTRDIGGITLPESDTDIAERVKGVFAAVYDTLGIQQLNTLYDRILVGLQRYDDKMNLTYLKELLEEDGSNTALKTLSQLRPFIDRNPFTDHETINWEEIMDNKGDIFVIQLTGYPRDVQLIITEFILWDLWNFSVRNGNKNNPLPVIMDEAQNLDHTEESPSARILTEGRKFGWSAWYATQFLKSQLDASELARLQNASQKIYFAPPEQELSTIASSLANEQYDRKYWEKVLSNLKKGQCIVQGPNLERNGSLSPTQSVLVNISSLNDRI
ncbi:DNA phosphorothioation-dependent restriction protein DptH [Lysinibacillus fusiformis]|uniref:DNA phosphorothioation-dependent restriction protein DptH n=1 Tax=Lysinibacillus fusiformis TaxID=28031 RepID=UPI0035C0AE03